MRSFVTRRAEAIQILDGKDMPAKFLHREK